MARAQPRGRVAAGKAGPAVELIRKVLENEEVRRHLKEAPEIVVKWGAGLVCESPPATWQATCLEVEPRGALRPARP